jgi:hypothetical protein
MVTGTVRTVQRGIRRNESNVERGKKGAKDGGMDAERQERGCRASQQAHVTDLPDHESREDDHSKVEDLEGQLQAAVPGVSVTINVRCAKFIGEHDEDA